MSGTHYDVLRVTRDAPPEVIRAAYKALSQMWHPDRNPSPEAGAIMQSINTAYGVLSDPSKRVQYDQSLRAAWSGFDINPQAASGSATSAQTSPPPRKGGRAFDIDWEAISRAQREQKDRYRVFGRANMSAATKTFGLLFGTIFLLLYLGSHS